MYFLVQSNIYSDPDHPKIMEALEDLSIPYETIELTAEMNEIQLKANRNDVFVYGTVKLARLAKANKDWTPGSFYGGNHLIEIYSNYYGAHLLNSDLHVFKFGDKIDWKEAEYKFIKPYKDAKAFTGKVFTALKWNDFVENAILHPQSPRLNSETLVQWSIPQQITKEARLWIIGGQIIEAVYYKFNEDVPFESEVAPEGIDFAKQMISIFEVAEAFVMDICLTNHGWKIVEINCINSAGFYPNVNVKSLIKAINTYFGE